MPLPRASPLVEEALDRLRSTPEVRPLLVLPPGAPPALEEYRSHPTEPRLVRQEPSRSGLAAAFNAGVARAEGEIVALLAPGTVPEAGWPLAQVEALRRRPEFLFADAAVRLLYTPRVLDSCGLALTPSGRPYKRGNRAEDPRRHAHLVEVAAARWVGGVYRLRLLRELGGFDEGLGDHHGDADLGWRAGARGYRGVYVPGPGVLHHPRVPLGDSGDFLAARVRSQVLLLAKNLPPSEAHRVLWVALEATRTGGRALFEGRVGGWLRGWLGGLRASLGRGELRHSERVHGVRGASWLARAAGGLRQQGLSWSDGREPRDDDREYTPPLADLGGPRPPVAQNKV
jgi:GT2 family glycosyltransferase